MKLAILLSISVLLLACISGAGMAKYMPGGPYYYKRWATNYQIPFTPVEEITEEEAKTAGTYLEAYFNDNGDIVQLTLFNKSKVQWVDRYYYKSPGKIYRREMTKSDGEIIIQEFDDEGSIIKN